MKLLFVCAISFFTLVSGAYPQQVERFEHLNTTDGLSQNSALSVFCDSKGFMWFGTMNGLNRYDGYQFNVYKVNESLENTLTHNRIDKIWEDERQIIWVKTYDGYVHYFVRETEEFITFPAYLKSGRDQNSLFSCFHQASRDEIWLGSTYSGAYRLQFNPETGRYNVEQFQRFPQTSRSISGNSISFIFSGSDQSIWIGTRQGLNQAVKKHDNVSMFRRFEQTSFTSAVQIGDCIYFGTQRAGIIKYNVKLKRFENDGDESIFIPNGSVTLLQKTFDNKLVIGTAKDGLFVVDLQSGETDRKLEGRKITKVYEDNNRRLWINTEEFGIYRYNPGRRTIKKYRLSYSETILIDDERQYLYEDSRHNIWIGFHGGLAFFNKANDEFEIYRNNPQDPASISSNIVYCITEDKSGLLWVGTGKPKGGVDKIIMSNPAFRHLSPAKNISDDSENVIRCLFRDNNNHLWAATKGGKVYILSPDQQSRFNFAGASFKTILQPDQNIYAIMEDCEGRIWMGSKGGGVFVSQKTVENDDFYRDPVFTAYMHDPEDPLSLSSNNIYSIVQDGLGRIWIGTYGGGLNLVKERGDEKLICKRINSSNSALSSDDVRHVYEDSQQRLWIATAFGLNLLKDHSGDEFFFRNFFYNPEDSTKIAYNDVVSIFEDSRKRLWFATFGGGLSQLISIDRSKAVFKRWTQKEGLINEAIASVLEDTRGRLWIGTEKGISRLNVETGRFENLDSNSGLPVENFSENTACVSSHGHLLYGSTRGIALIDPDEINHSGFAPDIVLTNFQVFNKDVDYRDEDAPIRQHIETLDKIALSHFQSSFSFEYAALSYFAPSKNQYAFKLEKFDRSWNEVGSQRKATYTNLPPGDYEFKVKAASWDGTWNELPRSISVTILPAWWETKAAFLGYLIFFIILFEVVRRVYLRYQRLQNDLNVEKRINEIKLKFFTNVSHEIRTPLTLILGPVADIKALKNVPENVLSKIDTMERNGKRMLRLVNQLLDFRKIQKNKMKLRIREFDLNAFVFDIVESFIPLAEHRNVDIGFKADKTGARAWIDPEQFDAVIFNILSNAVKFTPPGKGIKVEVDASLKEFIDIRISDQGPGIPKEKLSLLFQRFTPLSNAGDLHSSGIGLSLANEVVKLHQGTISVETAPGKGSCFIVRLPKGSHRIQAENTELSGAEQPYHPGGAIDPGPSRLHSKMNGQHHRILIVEDNPEIVNYLYESLSAMYELQSASSGKEALFKLSRWHPDLIITDVLMPEMDGVEMTRQIKDNLEVSHIPVVMLTARSSMEDQIMGIESGAEAYILKPFNSQYLKAVIRNLISQRETVYQKYFKTGKETENISITSKDEKFLEDVVKLIEENYQNPDFNVESLVDLSYVSRTVFYHKIKGLTGLSPSDFLRQMRMKIAGKLLLESGYNISEVAFLTGFNNVKYFRQHFKKIFGTTPNNYKTSGKKSGKQKC